MYTPGRPASKPWRITRNFSNFRADKMTSTWVFPLGDNAGKLEAFRQGLLPAWRLAHPCYTARVNTFWQFLGRCEVHKRRPNHRVYRREQRKQQRRLNAYLCDPDGPEWDVAGIDEADCV